MNHKIINPNILYYGFPVVLLTTSDSNNITNITPISSSWVLGKNVVVGIATSSKAYENLLINKEAVLNIPDPSLWTNVEKISMYTGKESVPKYKEDMGYKYTSDKFSIGNFTPEKSTTVEPLKIKECPLQLECIVEEINYRDEFAIIELKVQLIHAKEDIIFDDNYINPQFWSPLIYNFRSYHGLSNQLGVNSRGNK